MQELVNKPIDYWTSGTDQGCPGTFAWCAANKIFYEPKWAKGHPLQSSNATCVSVSLRTTTAELYQRNCSEPLNFICEVIYMTLYIL